METDFQFIDQFIDNIASLNQITMYTVIFLISLIFITVILRIVLSIAYQSQLTALRLSKKDKKSSLLKRVTNNYKSVCDKGIANINTEQIVNKHMMKLSLLGWSFESISDFIVKIETQAGFIGIATLFIPDTDKTWCVSVTAIMLAIFWILGSIFDYKSTKAKLKTELIDYIDNQEGKFYTKDMGSIIVSFKNELQSSILNTTKVLSDSINKMNVNLNETFKYGVENIIKTTESSMRTLTDYSSILKEPMEDWKRNLGKASELQLGLNETINTLNDSMTKFNLIYDKLDNQLKLQTSSTKDLASQIQNQINTLFKVITNLDDNSKNIALSNEALEKQLKYIENNQQLLDVTLQKYEGSVQEFTSNMGDSFGKIIDLYSQNASISISSEINQIVNKLADSNKDLIGAINENLTKLTNQNIILEQSILDIKDNIDISN